MSKNYQNIEFKIYQNVDKLLDNLLILNLLGILRNKNHLKFIIFNFGEDARQK